MMLGDLLAAARRSGADLETWLKPADPDLWTELRAEATRRQEDAAAFARGAVADFSDRASEEEWAMLVSRMRDTDDPGRALLLTMMRWRLDMLRNGHVHSEEEVTP